MRGGDDGLMSRGDLGRSGVRSTKCLCAGRAGGSARLLASTAGMPVSTTGAVVSVPEIGALIAIGAPAVAEAFDGRTATPGATKKCDRVTPPSWRAAAATGAGFAAATGAAFAVGIERRMRRAWLGSMPKEVTATTRTINTGSFFTTPLNQIGA